MMFKAAAEEIYVLSDISDTGGLMKLRAYYDTSHYSGRPDFPIWETESRYDFSFKDSTRPSLQNINNTNVIDIVIQW